MGSFVAPTGYIDLDNDCEYSIDRKSTRSRESVNPREDLAFYFNTYIVPKYGLDNINVGNCASFMKDLEMNWTKLTPELKQKVVDIMVDGIIEPDFQKTLYNKLSPNVGGGGIPKPAPTGTSSTFGNKSSFGSGGADTMMSIAVGFIILGLAIFLIDRVRTKTGSFPKIS
jgi:hypothetical protein